MAPSSDWIEKTWQAVSAHWGLKLVSLLLAIGVWFYATGEEMIEVTKGVPLKIETDKKEFSVSARSVTSISVRLKAPRSLLTVLSAADVSAFHKISGITQAGEYSFRIGSDDIRLPSSDIQVAGVFPEVISVSVDETIIKKLSVVPNLIGEPAFGYRALNEKIELDPNAILVEGPSAQLGKIDIVKTEPIDLVGRTHSFRKLARVVLDPNLRATSETIIDVYVPIHEEFAERTFSDIPVKPLGAPSAGNYVELETEKISFELKGPASELKQLSQSPPMVYIDVTGFEKGPRELPAQLILPQTVSLKNDPPLVRFEVKKIR